MKSYKFYAAGAVVAERGIDAKVKIIEILAQQPDVTLFEIDLSEPGNEVQN